MSRAREIRGALGLVSLLGGLLLAHPALAEGFTVDLGTGGTVTGRVMELVALLTVLSLAPSILVVMTSFTRIIVVLSLLRSALGLQTSPPNVVMISLALFLTSFIMAPTFQRSYQDGIQPLIAEKIDDATAFTRTMAPFQEFMVAHVRKQDLALFMSMAKEPPVASPADIPLKVAIPAFMISELRRAFEIGFLLFIPFIIIDMVVASVLMSMGMMMVPPATLSLPFKLIFFVMVDGWSLISGALVRSFG